MSSKPHEAQQNCKSFVMADHYFVLPLDGVQCLLYIFEIVMSRLNMSEHNFHLAVHSFVFLFVFTRDKQEAIRQDKTEIDIILE